MNQAVTNHLRIIHTTWVQLTPGSFVTGKATRIRPDVKNEAEEGIRARFDLCIWHVWLWVCLRAYGNAEKQKHVHGRNAPHCVYITWAHDKNVWWKLNNDTQVNAQQEGERGETQRKRWTEKAGWFKTHYMNTNSCITQTHRNDFSYIFFISAIIAPALESSPYHSHNHPPNCFLGKFLFFFQFCLFFFQLKCSLALTAFHFFLSCSKSQRNLNI